jgi:hypothetical protein
MRPYNAAGGLFGAPGDIRSADPRFTLSRAPGFANRPSSVMCRSDDALDAGGYSGTVAPASFLLNLTAPVIGAKALGVKQCVVRNLLPSVPDYQRWFIYQIRVASTGALRTFVFRYLQGVVEPLPIALTNTEFAAYVNQSVQYTVDGAGITIGGTVEVPLGQQVTYDWYVNQLQVAPALDNDLLPTFAADVSANKMAIELPVASGVPYGATDVLILPGIAIARTVFAPSAMPVTNGAVRYDLLLNDLVGQPARDDPWPYTAPRSPAPALLLPLFINIGGTQTIYVTSSITANGSQTVSNTSRSILATLPVSNEPNTVIRYEPSFVHWIWSLSSESIPQITIDLLDENLQPIVLPFNCLVEVEIAFLYEDSTL